MRRRRPVLLALSGVLLLGSGSLVPIAGPAQAASPSYPVARRYVASANTRMPGVSSTHWKISYRDDFTHGLSPEAWSIYDYPGSSNPNTAWYSAKHVTTSGGQLHIQGYVDRRAKSDGRVVTGGLGLWQRPRRYGKYEMLVRMQSCAQVKYAWMLWPYNNNWPTDGEIDFAEDEGSNRRLTTASLNYAGKGGRRATLKQDYATPAGGLAAWHVIGVEWTPTSVRYTMDGAHWGAVKTTHLPTTPMVLVMQTEGMALPGKANLPGGSCNADIGWVVQWSYRA